MKKLIIGFFAAVAAAVSFADSVARVSLDNGETWTEYETLDAAMKQIWTGQDTWGRPEQSPDQRFWILELLCDCTFSDGASTDLTRHNNIDVTIRSNPENGKRYVMSRTAASSKIRWKCHNSWHKGMKLRFENIVIDGGTVWTHPIDSAADEATNLASTGVDAGILLEENQTRGVVFGAGCVVRNAKGASGSSVLSFGQASSSAEQICFEKGAYVTGIRGAGNCKLVTASHSSEATQKLTFDSAADIDDCFAGASGSIVNLQCEAHLTGGEIKDNVSLGVIVRMNGGSGLSLSDVTIADNKIAGKSTDGQWTDAYGVVGIGNTTFGGYRFSGAVIVRNNTRIGDGSPAGVWSAGSSQKVAVDGPLDPSSWIEYGQVNHGVGEGNAIAGNYEIAATASGFERFFAIGNPNGGKYFVGKLNAAGDKIVYTAAKAYANAGVTQELTGDLGTGTYVFNFDESLTAGQTKVTGAVTWDADTVLSLGVSRAALAAAKGNWEIPILTATAINGFDTFLAAKGEALELPKNWELRKVTLASGDEQVQLVRKSPGLILLLR